MTITTVFDPPLPSDSREVFDQKAFDTVSKLNPWSSEANQTATDINGMVTSPGVIAIGSDLAGANTIGTVAAVAADVSAVAAIDADVSAVAAIAADVSAVAANEANINAAVADLPSLAAKVSKTGDTMTGHLEVPPGATGAEVPQAQEVVLLTGSTMTGPLSVPAGASGAQVPQAQEIPSLLGITGQVAFFACSTAPSGWLKANGATVSRTTYAALFAAIGTTFGVGDGSTTFELPDMRGEFIRGWDDGRGIDTGRIFGSAQVDEFKSHTHTATHVYQNVEHGGTDFVNRGATYYLRTPLLTTSSSGGTETRPRNVALLACIKY